MKFLILAILFAPIFSHAQSQELILREEVKVYEKKSRKSEVIDTLNTGARVPVSTVDYGPWYKIKLDPDGESREAWVWKKDLKKSRIRFMDGGASKKKSSVYHWNKSAGAQVVFTQVHIDPRQVSSSDGSVIYELDANDGNSIFFGFFYDYPWSKRWVVHSYVDFREHNLKGKGRTPPGSPQSAEISMGQKFVSFGMDFRYYTDLDGAFWYSFGVELAKGYAVDLTINDIPSPVSGDDLPFYAFVHAGLGYDFQFSNDFYIIPEIKAAWAANGKVLVYSVDATVNISYVF